jgi:hypothetical protein
LCTAAALPPCLQPAQTRCWQLFARARETQSCQSCLLPAVKSTTRESRTTLSIRPKSRDPTRLRPAHCKCISEHYRRRMSLALRRLCLWPLFGRASGAMPGAPCCRAARLSQRAFNKHTHSLSHITAVLLLTGLLQEREYTRGSLTHSHLVHHPRRPGSCILSLPIQRHLRTATLYTALLPAALLTRAATNARSNQPARLPRRRSTRPGAQLTWMCAAAD